MAGNTVDIERVRQARPGFRPLVIGWHWPSKPYGEEELRGSASFAGPEVGGASPIEEMIEDYAQTLAVIPTQSEHDTAVSTMYPLAAGAARQVHFAPGELPKYGELGTFGVRDPDVVDIEMLPADESYNFALGTPM